MDKVEDPEFVVRYCAWCVTPRITLTVPHLPLWDSTPLSIRPYLLSVLDKQMVYHTLNKLHANGIMIWSSKLTPFGFPVFVVWKTIVINDRPVSKDRAVVYI